MIAIIDYGVGNLFSLQSSCKYIGQEAVVTADPTLIEAADQIILPGVGAYEDAAKKLRELSLDSSLPYYMQYKVLGDLESAANAVGDINLAYSSSRRRLELIDRIRF